MATITGTSKGDNLNGTGLADQISGLGGADTLVGYDGDDVLEGGAGADELFGSDGFDIASYRGSNQGVSVNLRFFYASGGHATGDHLYSIEGLIGSAYDDMLYGSEQGDVLKGEGGHDWLVGYSGDDRLEGGGGNDQFDGGAGADELRGGSGVDLAYYGGSASAVTVDLATGRGFGGDAEGDRLIGIENVEGSTRGDQLIGDAAANRLLGHEGNDVIAGGGGNDVIAGGAGSDQLDGGAGIDTLDYSSAAGGVRVDLVMGRGEDDAPGDSVTGFERIIGSSFHDILIGDSGANGLSGGYGDDVLYGGLGRDELTGGAGADRFRFGFTTESGKTAATRDVVHDFHNAEDYLDLSQLDASTGRTGDQDPTFIGQRAFTAEGQVRFFFEGDHTVVEVNTTGTSGADMQIQLDGRVQLAAADFLFID